MTDVWSEDGARAVAAAVAAALGRPVAHYRQPTDEQPWRGAVTWLWPAGVEEAEEQRRHAVGVPSKPAVPAIRLLDGRGGWVASAGTVEAAVAMAARHMQPRRLAPEKAPLAKRILAVLQHFDGGPGGRPMHPAEVADILGLGAVGVDVLHEMNAMKRAGRLEGLPDGFFALPPRRQAAPA